MSFKAEDSIGNTKYKNIGFYIDTKKPKITKVKPGRGFASGIFSAQFIEENPSSLKLNYGKNLTDYNTYNLDLENECILDKGKYDCKTSLGLSQYDSQTIIYWFEIRDIADMTDSSKPIELEVDTTFPLINSLEYFINKRKVDIKINITENNFQDVGFIDSKDKNPKFKRLCLQLSRGMCSKTITLNEGSHDIEVKVSDKSGNTASQNLNISIES